MGSLPRPADVLALLLKRVIGGVDCGFGTSATQTTVDADIAFAKLASLVEGAAIASKRLAQGSNL